MNINFIGKEFERLAKLEDCINYEYEPKTSFKFGKRNIYFDDIKLDFINEVNTYGFSPFILESFIEQRDDPNIMRFITKKFNHGLTNYIKAQTKELTIRTNKSKKKLFINKSAKNLKNSNNNKVKKDKKENLISNIFLIKKNEDIKKNEEKENFLQKALGGVGGYKLNISTEEDKDKDRDKLLKDKKFSLDKKTNEKDKNKLESINEKSNIDILKKIFTGNEKKNKNKEKEKEKLPDLNYIPGVNYINYDDFKQGNLKSLLDKINKLSLDNPNYDYDYDKKILTLSKNRNILGNKKIFTSITKNIFKNEKIVNFKKGKKMIRNNSMDPKKYKIKNKSKDKNKDTFLLFTKARPYRYMSYKDNNIKNKTKELEILLSNK